MSTRMPYVPNYDKLWYSHISYIEIYHHMSVGNQKNVSFEKSAKTRFARKVENVSSVVFGDIEVLERCAIT